MSSRRVHVLTLFTIILLAAPRAAAQCDPLTEYAPVQNCLYSYTGDEDPGADATNSISHNCLQQYRLYVPAGTPPGDGWPVAIRATLANFATSVVDPCVDKTSMEGQLLEHGVAVIVASFTTSTNSLDCEDEPVECGNEPATEVVPGDGTFHPPGFVPPDLMGSGLQPYASTHYDMPEKDAVMLVQHVRHNAGRANHLLQPIDGRRIAVVGGSASAMSFMWTAFGPDRRDKEPFLSLGGQFDEKTRPDVAALGGGAVWFPIFHGNVTSVPGAFELHFGDNGHSENGAPNFAACSKYELQQGSALFYEAVYKEGAPNEDLEPSLPLLLTYNQPSYCHDYSSNAPTPDYAYSFTLGGREGPVGTNSCGDSAGGIHPRWSGFLWKALHPAVAQLWLGTAAPACDGEEDIEHQTLGGSQSFDDITADWLAARLAETPSPWSVFEYAEVSGAKARVAIEGAGGVPELTGVGALTSGTGNKIVLRHGLPNATVYVIFSATTAMLPVLGGVSLVTLDRSPLSMPLDSTGYGELSVNQLASDRDSTWWFQVWTVDPSAVQGWSASNAIRAMVPGP